MQCTTFEKSCPSSEAVGNTKRLAGTPAEAVSLGAGGREAERSASPTFGGPGGEEAGP